MRLDRHAIAAIICRRMAETHSQLAEGFRRQTDIRTRYVVLDDLLPSEVARKVYEAFPEVRTMRLMSSFRERKYTSKALNKLAPIVGDVTFALQSAEVIQEVSKITGMAQLVGDPYLYAGGISAMTKGHFLNPHIDNSHDAGRTTYRVLNLLYYVTPGWKREDGGNLELWDTNVLRHLELPSTFNRLVIMETNKESWHSVNAVRGDGVRCCVSNYFFSPAAPGGVDYFHVTEFSARPEQKVRRLVARADNGLRMLLRKAIRFGLAKRDVYPGPRRDRSVG